jgi:hypothetical protein
MKHKMETFVEANHRPNGPGGPGGPNGPPPKQSRISQQQHRQFKLPSTQQSNIREEQNKV